MIVPKYDNRYFGSIAEKFEEMARARGLLPIITCTRRQPELEIEAARAMLSWQVDWVIATGATQPDKIAQMCQQAGVPTLNLDLPGTLAPSIISITIWGEIIDGKNFSQQPETLWQAGTFDFVGGRISDNNTAERLRGFVDAHQALGITVPDEHKLVTGYSSARVEDY